jgi:hypothetical protein
MAKPVEASPRTLTMLPLTATGAVLILFTRMATVAEAVPPLPSEMVYEKESLPLNY